MSAECNRTVTPAEIVSLIEAGLRDNGPVLVGDNDAGHTEHIPSEGALL